MNNACHLLYKVVWDWMEISLSGQTTYIFALWIYLLYLFFSAMRHAFLNESYPVLTQCQTRTLDNIPQISTCVCFNTGANNGSHMCGNQLAWITDVLVNSDIRDVVYFTDEGIAINYYSYFLMLVRKSQNLHTQHECSIDKGLIWQCYQQNIRAVNTFFRNV